MVKIEDLNNRELISLIKSYDDYIVNDICEDPQNIINRRPTCIGEYLNKELPSILETVSNMKLISFEEEYADEFTEATTNIIDIFENALEQNDIYLPDDARTGNEEEACIYGETYYEMESSIEDELLKFIKEIKDSNIQKVNKLPR